MEKITNSGWGGRTHLLLKFKYPSPLKKISVQDMTPPTRKYHTNSTTTSKVRLTLLPQQQLLFHPRPSHLEWNASSKKSLSILSPKGLSYPYDSSIFSKTVKVKDSKSSENLMDLKNKRNFIQLSNYYRRPSDLSNTLIRKNAVNNSCNNNKNNLVLQAHFHSAPILKDQDDDMPKFRDSREKKEYIKLATKRNDIAAKGRMEGSYHWALSKLVIAGILACVVASGIVGHHMFIDVMLGALLPMHVYYTFQDLIFDYIPSRRYPRANKYLIWLLRLTTVISLFSMFKFNTQDIGISDAAKQAWNAAKTQKPDEEIKDEDIFYDSK